MINDKRFYKNISYIGISNIISASTQWGILVLIAKIGDINDLARFSLGLAIATPVTLFLGANLRVYISTDVHRQYTFSDYIAVRIITSLISLLSIMLLGLAFGYLKNTLFILLLIGVVKIIEGFQEICWGINQRADFMDPVGISRFLRSITAIVSVWTGMFLTGNLIVGIILWIISWIIILFLYDFPKAKKIEGWAVKINFDNSIRIFRRVSPLAFIAGLGALTDKVTQYQIATLLGEVAVGYYSPLAYIIQGVGLGVISASEATTPRLAKYYYSDRKAFIRGTLYLSGIGAVIGIIALIFLGTLRNFILPLLYTREFLVYQNLFLLLLVTGVIRFAQTGFGVGVTAARQLTEQLPILLSVLFITVLTGWVWIPEYGLNGAAYSVGVGSIYSLIAFVILWLKSNRKHNIAINESNI